MPRAGQVAQQLQHLCQDFLLSQLPEQARHAALAAAAGAAQGTAHESEQDDEMHEADVQQCTTTVPQGEALLLVFSMNDGPQVPICALSDMQQAISICGRVSSWIYACNLRDMYEKPCQSCGPWPSI